MPCGYFDNRIDYEAENKKLEIEHSHTIALLCSACRALEGLKFNFALNPELDRWFHQHKIEDQARLEQELKEQKKAEERRRKAEIKAKAKALKLSKISEKKVEDLTEEEFKILKNSDLFKYRK